MKDLIERQEAIDAIGKTADELYKNIKKGATFPQRQWFDGMAHAQSILENLPSARKHGKWVKARGSWSTPGGDPVWECSECGKGVHVYGVDKIISNIEWRSYGRDVADGQWVSCPNCGAMMEIDDESNQ